MKISEFDFKIYGYVNKRKNYPEKSGVYVIFISNRYSKRKVYIGSTSNFSTRILSHDKIASLKSFINKREKIEIGILENMYSYRLIESWLILKHKPLLNEFNGNRNAQISCLHTLMKMEPNGTYNKFMVDLYQHVQRFVLQNKIHNLAFALKLGCPDPHLNKYFTPFSPKVSNAKYRELMRYIGVNGKITTSRKGTTYDIEPFIDTQLAKAN